MARETENLDGSGLSRRSRRGSWRGALRAAEDALLAPLPEYGTLPPRAAWHQAPESVQQPALGDERRGPGPGSGSGGSGGTQTAPRRKPSTARPVGATAVPGLVPGAFVRPLRAPSSSAGTVLTRHEPMPGLDPLPRLTAPLAFDTDELLDPMADARLRGVTVVAGVLAGAVTLPPALGLGTAGAAIDPMPNPKPAVALPAGVEAYAPYIGQKSCDPHAKPGVLAFSDLVLSYWKHGSSAGITRSCGRGGMSEHKEGRAWDFALNPFDYSDQVAGQRVVDWLLADDALNARRLGIMYIIWNERIWSTYQRADGWRPYSGPDNHTSHIHFSFSWAGAMKRTSWWTGSVAPTEYGPCQKYIGQSVPVYGTTINVSPCPAPKKKPKPKPDDKGKSERKKDDTGKDAPKAESKPAYVTITVRSGDTVAGIARRHDTSVAKIVSLNKLANPNQIYVGQKLRVPAKGSAGSNKVSAADTRPAGETKADQKPKSAGFRVITVASGDTLARIARRYDSTVEAIVKANSLSDPDRIYPGQKLKIPT